MGKPNAVIKNFNNTSSTSEVFGTQELSDCCCYACHDLRLVSHPVSGPDEKKFCCFAGN